MSRAIRNSDAWRSLPALAQSAVVEGGGPSLGRVLAAAALCTQEQPCRTQEPSNREGAALCEQCARAMDGSHPDLMTLDASDGKAQIERVRALRAAALTRPFLSDRRVFVVEHAEGLSEPSQNALLKVMEEPPDYARFILLAARAEALLPTVRSRCAVYRLKDSGEESEASPEADKQSALLLEALGSELDACRVIMGWTRTPREDFARLLAALLAQIVEALAQGRGNPTQLHRLADTIRDILDQQTRNVSVSASCAKLLSILNP
jgi:DNA polymerase III delta prime subunit